METRKTSCNSGARILAENIELTLVIGLRTLEQGPESFQLAPDIANLYLVVTRGKPGNKLALLVLTPRQVSRQGNPEAAELIDRDDSE